MGYRLLADVVVLAHTAFVGFVLLGGFLAWRWNWLAWLHLPCAVWGAVIEYQGWVCPLTPLENALRRRAGLEGYAGGFVEHYLVPVIYPPGLTPALQMALGLGVLAANVAVYAWVWRKRQRSRVTLRASLPREQPARRKVT